MKGDWHRGGHILQKTYNTSGNTKKGEKGTWNLPEPVITVLLAFQQVQLLLMFQSSTKSNVFTVLNEWNFPILTTHSFIHSTSFLASSTATCGQRMGSSPMEHKRKGYTPSLAHTTFSPTVLTLFFIWLQNREDLKNLLEDWATRQETESLTDWME